MKTVREIQDNIEFLTDDASALSNLSEKEDRNFNADEQKRWDEIMGENGEIAKAKAALESAQKLANERTLLANLRKDITPAVMPTQIEGNGNKITPQVHFKRVGPLKAFKSEQDAYDTGQWLKAVSGHYAGNQPDRKAESYCATRGWDIFATQEEGTDTKGGFLVPTPLSNIIIDVRDQTGLSRRLSRVIPMTGDVLDVATSVSGTTVKYPGESGAIVESEKVWGIINLVAVKRAVLAFVSQELNDDAIISVMDDLASQIGFDLAVNEDEEWINGDGTGSSGGVTGFTDSSGIGSAGINDAATGIETWGELDLEDFSDTQALLPSEYWNRGVSWVVSPQFYYGVMQKLLNNAGGNTISTLESGVGNAQFLGVPVFFTSSMPQATAVSTISALFGSFSDASLIGDRMGVRIAQSSDYAFNTDRLAIRATSRYDIQNHDIGDGSNAGAVVALKTAAS